IGRTAQKHGIGGHEAALGSGKDRAMASAAGLVSHSIVGRIDETDELGRLAIEQRVAALGFGAVRIAPLLRVAWQNVCEVPKTLVFELQARKPSFWNHTRISSMAIGATQLDRRIIVH